jgi:uncharacterized RDD family membrane protein YckC
MINQNTPFTGHSVAPHHKRITNFIADSLICYCLTLALGELGILLYNNYGFDALLIGEPRWDNLKFSLANSTVAVVYYGLFESLTQRTPGKYITGTKVVLHNGTKPGEGTILLRSLCRQIPLEALSFLGPYGIGLHDIFSKTLVVELYKRGPVPPDNFKDEPENNGNL